MAANIQTPQQLGLIQRMVKVMTETVNRIKNFFIQRMQKFAVQSNATIESYKRQLRQKRQEMWRKTRAEYIAKYRAQKLTNDQLRELVLKDADLKRDMTEIADSFHRLIAFLNKYRTLLERTKNRFLNRVDATTAKIMKEISEKKMGRADWRSINGLFKVLRNLDDVFIGKFNEMYQKLLKILAKQNWRDEIKEFHDAEL